MKKGSRDLLEFGLDEKHGQREGLGDVKIYLEAAIAHAPFQVSDQMNQYRALQNSLTKLPPKKREESLDG